MIPGLWTIIQAAMTVAPAVESIARQRMARREETVARDAAAEREALQYAWQAFEFHARQRTVTVAAFVVALSVLAVAYTVALGEDLLVLAALLAATGLGTTLFFNRFDALNRLRLHNAERALGSLEERLAVAAAAPEIVLSPGSAGRLYQDALILTLQLLSFAGFLAAMLYAAFDA